MILVPWTTRAVQEAIDKQSRSNQRAIDLAMPLGKRDNTAEERKTEMPVFIDGSGNMAHYPRKDESNDIMVSDLRSHIRELIETHCDVELKKHTLRRPRCLLHREQHRHEDHHQSVTVFATLYGLNKVSTF